MVHLFVTGAMGLAAKLDHCRAAIGPDGMIWVSWPKKSSGVATDLTDVVVRDTAIPLGPSISRSVPSTIPGPD